MIAVDSSSDEEFWEDPLTMKLVGESVVVSGDWDLDLSDSGEYDLTMTFPLTTQGQTQGQEEGSLNEQTGGKGAFDFSQYQEDESDSDCSDWEMDFQNHKHGDISEKPAMNPSLSLNQSENDVDVSKYSLIPEDRQIKKITFPSPSHLETLEGKDGTKYFSSENLYKWLKNIFTRNSYAYRFNDINLEELKKKNRADLKNIPDKAHLTMDWLSIFLDTIYPIYLKKEESIWKETGVFAKDLKDMSGPIQITHKMIDYITVILHIFSVQWSESINPVYISFMQLFKDIVPSLASYIDSIILETHIHNGYTDKSTIDNLVSLYKEALSQKESEEVIIARGNSLANLQYILNGYSPLNCRPFNTFRNLEVDNYTEKIFTSDDFRKETLFDIYKKIPPSYLKAKIGLSIAIGDDFEENLLFEVIYILDELSPINDDGKCSLLFSDLGYTTLSYYADSLLDNDKYKYAMLVYEAVLDIYEVTKQKNAFNTLLQEMAKVVNNHGDIPRAVDFYRVIQENYYEQKSKKIIEITHVSRILSTLYIDLGDFPNAIEFLVNASNIHEQDLSKFKDPNCRSNTLSNTFIELEIEIAKCYLMSYKYEEAGKIVERLLCFQLPKTYHLSAIDILIKGYIKKRWYDDAKIYLETYRVHCENDNVATANFLFLSSKNYLYANHYNKAFHCIDKAILITSPEKRRTLGKYYRFRGKILSQVILDCSILYPLRLNSVSPMKGIDEGWLGSNKYQTTDTVYNNKTDLIQECYETLVQSYNYFKECLDDSNIAKTLIMISDIFIEYLFEPLVIQNCEFEQISKFPKFEVSFIALNKRNPEQPISKEDPVTEDFHKPRNGSSSSMARRRRLTVTIFQQLEEEGPFPDIPSNFTEWTEVSSDSGDIEFEEIGPLVSINPGGNRTYEESHFSDSEELQQLSFTEEKWDENWSESEDGFEPSLENIKDMWVESSSIDDDNTGETLYLAKNNETQESPILDQFTIEFNNLLNPAEVCLETCARFSNLQLIIKCYLVMSEIHFLKGDTKVSKEYFDLFVNHLSLFFLDDDTLFIEGCPPSGLTFFKELLSRGSRLLLFYEPDFITKHIVILDSCVKVFYDLEEKLKEYIPVDSADTKPPSKKKIFSFSNSSGKKSMDFGKRVKKEIENEQLIKAFSENAEKTWGYLYYLKIQIKKFSEGKISLETLKERNKRCIRSMKKNASIFRTHDLEKIRDNNTLTYQKNRLSQIRRQSVSQASSVTKNIDSINPVAIKTTVQFQKKTIYLLNIKQYIYCYSGTIGTTYSKIPSGYLNFNQKKGKADFFFIRLNLENKSKILRVPAEMKLENLQFYLDTYNQGSKKSKSLSKRHKLSMIEEIGSSIDFDRSMSGKTSIVLAKAGIESQYLSLVGFDRYPIHHFFSSISTDTNSEENPFDFFVFSELPETEGAEFGKVQLSYIHHLMHGKLTQLQNLNFISGFQKKFSFYCSVAEQVGNLDLGDQFPYPIVLMMTPALQVVPWELISPPLIRSFSKHSLEEKISISKALDITDSSKPKENYLKNLNTFFAFFNSSDKKEERLKRKDYIEQSVLSNVYRRKQVHYDGNYKAIFPFYSKDIRKKKLKYVNIIDTSYLENPEDLLYIQAPSKNPIFVFTFLDLLEMSETINLIRKKPITMIFVPRSHMRMVMTQLNDLQVKGEKGKVSIHNRYMLLMDKIVEIQQQESIPIAVFNPPV
eukprot:TRINITY_DN3508_c0_g1_i1.p1 TRINITY_DN3508_c0_g1~~TRINITY_DN3508_c0_g1_i1.p1  ORF type:complete len:1702 (+),score=350.55 TRINITY_DN3508_c0_g1_i1:31-5136(+)